MSSESLIQVLLAIAISIVGYMIKDAIDEGKKDIEKGRQEHLAALAKVDAKLEKMLERDHQQDLDIEKLRAMHAAIELELRAHLATLEARLASVEIHGAEVDARVATVEAQVAEMQRYSRKDAA